MVNQPAHFGYSCRALPLACLALLGGCQTQWGRWDDCYLRSGYSKEQTLAYERAITSFRPGRTSQAEVEGALGPFVKKEELSHLAEDGSSWHRWRDDWRGWSFVFTKDGVLRSFSRVLHGNMGTFDTAEEAREFERWYQDRLAFLPVAEERASEFVPGTTTQEQVYGAWGVCQGAEARGGDHFVMRWGSTRDTWTLEFDGSGVLASAPRH